MNNDFAKRPDVLRCAIAVLLRGKILGHIEQASIDVLKLRSERFGGRGGRLRKREQRRSNNDRDKAADVGARTQVGR